MKNLNTGLILSLALDEINNGQVVDQSEPVKVTNVHGEVLVVPDDLFGSCVSFDGASSYIEVDNITQSDHKWGTWSCWVKPAAEGVIYDNGQMKISSIGGQFDCEIKQGETWSKLTANCEKGLDCWYHLTLVQNDESRKLSLYLDGKLVQFEDAQDELSLSGSSSVVLGASHAKESEFFSGQLAHLHVYDRSLNEEEIAALMQRGKTAQATFKREYPIDFSLIDDEEYNVFYISNDQVSNHFQLELTNTSGLNLEFLPTEGNEASPENHHLALSFKPKTFDDGAFSDESGTVWRYLWGLELPEGWRLSPAEEHADGKVSVYLLYTGGEPFNADEILNFTLEYGSADGSGGARSTSVLLSYKGIRYANQPNTIQGSRLQHVDIINQRGKRNIPLQVGIVGSNAILNDAGPGNSGKGTSNTLKIQLANLLQEGELLFNISEVNTERNTKFTLLFDDPAGDDWDLATKDQLNAIELTETDLQVRKGFLSRGLMRRRHGRAGMMKRPLIRKIMEKPGSSDPQNMPQKRFRIDKNTQGNSPVFEITPMISALRAGEVFELFLTNIHSNSPSGFSNIYIQYEDVPGYVDGQFVLQVEKSPIVHKDLGDKKNVGIGVAPDAANRLKVDGDTRMNGNVIVQQSIGGSSRYPSNLIRFEDKKGQEAGVIGGTMSDLKFYSRSDDHLKLQKKTTRYGLSTLRKIQVKDYKVENRLSTGFDLKELYKVYPYPVYAPNGSRGELEGIDYGRLTPLLVKSIQDLENRLRSLEHKVSNQIKSQEKTNARHEKMIRDLTKSLAKVPDNIMKAMKRKIKIPGLRW